MRQNPAAVSKQRRRTWATLSMITERFALFPDALNNSKIIPFRNPSQYNGLRLFNKDRNAGPEPSDFNIYQREQP